MTAHHKPIVIKRIDLTTGKRSEISIPEAHPVGRIVITTDDWDRWRRTNEQLETVIAQRDALRDALAAAICRERAVGGYCTHGDQQARRDAEALVVEAGGRV